MLQYFPTPYPDELWYSVLCRYHVRTGNSIPILTIRELFQGRSFVNIGTIFPNNSINDIIIQLPKGMLDHEDIAINHTLFPYSYRFRSLTDKEKMIDMIKEGKVRWPPSLSVGQDKNPSLKYCPICKKQDIENYGETYWHVTHQLPLASLCHKHKCRLIVIKSKERELDRKLLLLENFMDETIDYSQLPYESFLTDIVTQYQWLPLYDGPNFEFNNIFEELYNKGYGLHTHESTQITNIKKLGKALVDFYGEDMVVKYFLSKEVKNKTMHELRTWTSMSPERYALLAAFLNQPPERTFSNQKIENRYKTEIAKYSDNYKGETRKFIAKQLGLWPAQVDIYADIFGLKKPWTREARKNNSKILFSVSLEEKEKIKEYMNHYGYLNYSSFLLYCAEKEMNNNNKKSNY